MRSINSGIPAWAMLSSPSICPNVAGAKMLGTNGGGWLRLFRKRPSGAGGLGRGRHHLVRQLVEPPVQMRQKCAEVGNRADLDIDERQARRLGRVHPEDRCGGAGLIASPLA